MGVSTLFAQETNIFWSRDFWSPETTLKDVQEKIKEGNDATALNTSGFDATANAILASAPDAVIKHLLSLDGNDVNKITHDGRTYLFWAAIRGNRSIMEYLLDHSAKTDILDDKGSSVLLFAAGGGQSDPALYDLLLDHGASITATTPKGANAILQLMSNLKDLDETKYFLDKGLDLNSTDNAGLNAVDYAARTGNKEIIEQLIKEGVSYNDTNTDGSNAILVASQGSRGSVNSLEFFSYLEGLGVAPNIVDNEGVTPLHNSAPSNKDLALFNYFIGKGVSANKADHNGNTPLMNAAGRNDLETIKFFLEKTSDLNAVNNEGKSALTNAIHSNSPEVVQYLLEKGADLNILDKDGNNLAYYLVDSFSKRDEAIFNKKWELLTNKGLDIPHVQKEGNTLLHFAVIKNDIDLLDKITAYKVDVNAKNDNGLTPLHTAAMTSNNIEIIKHLLELGADASILSDFDETVYELALENELLENNKVAFLKQ